MRLSRRNIVRIISGALVVFVPVQVAAAVGNDHDAPGHGSARSAGPRPSAFVGAPVTGAATATVTKTSVLDDIRLGAFQNALLPDSIADDRGLTLGSIGSGIFPLGGNEYWTVTDRGPNAEPFDDVHTFVLPAFDPALVRVKVRGKSVDVLESIPITGRTGKPVSGLANRALGEESLPYASDVSTVLPYNPNGLDPEGVARTADGHFWICDEYAPSIVELSARGRVIARHVPAGTEEFYRSAGVDYRVEGSLPAALAARKSNRGLEDVALLPDGRTIVTALQSSIVVPGQKDRIVTELLTFDTKAGTPVHEFGYKFDEPTTFAPGTRGRNLKISALVPIDNHRVIVQERTDTESRYYLVKLDPTDDLITEADKTLVANLAGVAGIPDKIEGAALKNPSTLVLAADNDFGFVQRPYALDEPIDNSGVPTEFVEVKLR